VRTEGRLGGRRARTLFLQPLAADQRGIWRYLPLFPLAAERLPVVDARVVMASSSAFAHGVASAPDAVDVSYCYSPSRYVWHERDRTERGGLAAVRPAARAVLGSMRQRDRHKNTELALAAAARAGVKIKVVGDGPDVVRLR
jgi:hypothetical protein